MAGQHGQGGGGGVQGLLHRAADLLRSVASRSPVRWRVQIQLHGAGGEEERE